MRCEEFGRWLSISVWTPTGGAPFGEGSSALVRYRCPSCCCGEDHHAPRSPCTCQRDGQPSCWSRALQSQILKAVKYFSEFKMNLRASLKLAGRQATCGNRPSAEELVVCAARISLKPPSSVISPPICYFPAVTCCNLALWAALALSQRASSACVLQNPRVRFSDCRRQV